MTTSYTEGTLYLQWKTSKCLVKKAKLVELSRVEVVPFGGRTLLGLSLLETSHKKCSKKCLLPQMQRHNLAQHMQEFTQMHMRYMANFLCGLSLNGTSHFGPSVSSEDLVAGASASASSSVSASASSGPRGDAACSSNYAPCQPNEVMQRLREMDGRLVKQDHQLRELIILKETQVGDVLVSEHIKIHIHMGLDLIANQSF